METSKLKDLVNEMNWSYSHNGNASVDKLDKGINYLNSCEFTEQDIEDAIDNNGFVDMDSDLNEIAKTIAPNLGADKLRADGLYYEYYDENASFELL